MRKPYKVVKVTTNDRCGRCGRVNALCGDALDALKLVSHTGLQCLRDALVLVARLISQDELAYVMGDSSQEGELDLIERLRSRLTQHKVGTSLSPEASQVEDGTHGRRT